MWFQKLLPNLKDKQASNCEDGRGKSQAQLLLHTQRAMKDVHACPLAMTVWTPPVCTILHPFLSLSLSLHTGVERNRQIEINSFFINNSQCQVAALIAIHWVSKRNAYLCPGTVITMCFILPPGVLLNVTKYFCLSSSEQRLFINEENTSSKMQLMLLIREHENKFLKKDLLSRMLLCMPINHNIETTESRSE